MRASLTSGRGLAWATAGSTSPHRWFMKLARSSRARSRRLRNCRRPFEERRGRWRRHSTPRIAPRISTSRCSRSMRSITALHPHLARESAIENPHEREGQHAREPFPSERALALSGMHAQGDGRLTGRPRRRHHARLTEYAQRIHTTNIKHAPGDQAVSPAADDARLRLSGQHHRGQQGVPGSPGRRSGSSTDRSSRIRERLRI